MNSRRITAVFGLLAAGTWLGSTCNSATIDGLEKDMDAEINRAYESGRQEGEAMVIANPEFYGIEIIERDTSAFLKGFCEAVYIHHKDEIAEGNHDTDTYTYEMPDGTIRQCEF